MNVEVGYLVLLYNFNISIYIFNIHTNYITHIMAKNSENALLTYAEICKLWHFCQFRGSISSTSTPINVDVSYDSNWNGTEEAGTATYGFFFIHFNNSQYFSGYSSLVSIYGNISNPQVQYISYVDLDDTIRHCLIEFIFRWSTPFDSSAKLIINRFGYWNNEEQSRFITRSGTLSGSSIIGYLFMSEQ